MKSPALLFAATATVAVATVASLAPAGLASAAPVRYEIDPTHTFIYFEVKHNQASTVRARFAGIDGFVELDQEAKSGKTEMTVDMNSVDSGIEKFDEHLKNADFFNVPKWPSAKFVSDRFGFDADKVKSVEGRLTLLGTTKPVTLTATSFNCYQSRVLSADVCGGDFETTLQRSEWGMNWGIDKGVPDSVRLLIQIEAVKK